MKYKKAILFLFCLLALTAFVAVGAGRSMADDASDGITRFGNIPGTNKDLMAMQMTRAQGRKMRDKALSVEIIRKPEAIMDMVCLPKLVGNFSGISGIFSDLTESFSFSFSGDSLCKMMFGASGGLSDNLSALFKVAATGTLGLNLPPLSVCTGSFNIGAMFPISLGASYNANPMFKVDTLGCSYTFSIPISMSFQVDGVAGASIDVPSYCATLQFDPFPCTGMSTFMKGIIPNLPTDSTAKLLGIDGSGANGGVGYASSGDEVALAGGGEFSLLKAIGGDDMEAAFSLMSQMNLDLSVSTTWSVDTDDTTKDGFSGDRNLDFGAGAMLKAGSGADWKKTYTDSNDLFTLIGKDMEKMKQGPGHLGTVWKVRPSISARADAMAVIDLMKVGRSIEDAASATGGETPATPATP